MVRMLQMFLFLQKKRKYVLYGKMRFISGTLCLSGLYDKYINRFGFPLPF